MTEYLTKSDMRFIAVVKAEDEKTANLMHKEIVDDLTEMLEKKFNEEGNSWKFDGSHFTTVTKLPERKNNG